MATATVQDEFTPVPLSEYPDPLIGFCRSYVDVRSSKRDDLHGDTMLLAELERAIGPRGARPVRVPGNNNVDFDRLSRAIPARPRTVRDLGVGTVEEIVESVEQRMNGRWELDGDESTDIFDRLDMHFMPLQEAYARGQRERRARVEQQIAGNEALARQQADFMSAARERELEAELAAIRGRAG